MDFVLVESGGDNFSVIFSLEFFDLMFYVIDVLVGDKIFCKGGSGIIKFDLFIINKIDIVDMVGVLLDVMDMDIKCMCGDKFFVFINLKVGEGLVDIINFIEVEGMLVKF